MMTDSGTSSDTGSLFYEEQRFTQPWILILLIVVVILTWWGFFQQVVGGRPLGDRPAPDAVMWIILSLIGVGLPVLFVTLRLQVRVHRDRVDVRFAPFTKRTIPVSDIESCYARQYRPIREYGGWGIRYGGKRGMAYNVSGRDGVQLELKEGRKLLIGSQRAHELAAAINRARGQ